MILMKIKNQKDMNMKQNNVKILVQLTSFSLAIKKNNNKEVALYFGTENLVPQDSP